MSDAIDAPAAGALVRLRAGVPVCAGKRDCLWYCDSDFDCILVYVGVIIFIFIAITIVVVILD